VTVGEGERLFCWSRWRDGRFRGKEGGYPSLILINLSSREKAGHAKGGERTGSKGEEREAS